MNKLKAGISTFCVFLSYHHFSRCFKEFLNCFVPILNRMVPPIWLMFKIGNKTIIQRKFLIPSFIDVLYFLLY